MRGKDAFISPYGDIPGITPAHAGKRIGFSAFSGLSGDHPRTCGEKSLMRSLHTGRLGSPPHMRGKVGHCLASNSILGITPAHAGKRSPAFSSNSYGRDHPRTCGEKSLMRSLHTGRLGSPPHMRGKVGHCLASNSILGITPAHAGKRSPAFSSNSYGRDHPRTCGEKEINEAIVHHWIGSPPHMRGKVDFSGHPPFLQRITPAHAGKSQYQRRQAGYQKDHPRTCGEKTKKIP